MGIFTFDVKTSFSDKIDKVKRSKEAFYNLEKSI